MKTRNSALCLLLACTVLLSALPLPALAQDDFAAALEARYRNPDRQYATEVRWWMAEGAHTDETLLEEVQAMYDAGFRGMELCEQTDDQVSEADYGYGTDQWDHDLKLVLNKALDLGMTVSLTSGTNWATANIPGLDPQSQAASQIVFCIEEYLKAGKSRSGAIPMEKKAGVKKTPVAETAALIGAYALRQTSSNKVSPILFDAESVIDLTGSITTEADGTRCLDWAVPDDSAWRIFYYWQQGAEQQSHPSAEPAYCINYFDEAGVAALRDYWEAHILDDAALNEKIKAGDVQLFMDSLEIALNAGITFWAQDMAEEFIARKGYDIRPWLFLTTGLPELAAWELPDCGTYDLDGQAELRGRILNDLFDVQTQLYMERMLTPLRAWLHEAGIQTRAQISYGRYLEISEPIQAVDYPEAENLNQTNQVDIYRLWTGGSKLQNKVLSSETGAVGGHNYTYQDHLMEAYTLYAAGFSRIIWHVWSSRFGPGENWNWPTYRVPGVVFHSFYTFGQGEPSTADDPAFNSHLARVQQLLREGQSRTDIGMVYLRYDQNLPLNGNPTGVNWLYSHQAPLYPSTVLQDSGYTYDYFSPAFLLNEEVTLDTETLTLEQAGYKALVVWQETLPLYAAEQLLSLARQGLPVLVVDGAARRTPYNDGQDEALAAVMAQLTQQPNTRVLADADAILPALAELDIAPYTGYSEPNHQLLTQTRRDGDAEYLYVYNYCDGSYIPAHSEGETDDHGLSITTELVVEGTWQPYQLDAWSGEATALGLYRHEDGKTILPLTLDYGDVALFALKACQADEVRHAVDADAAIATVDGTLTAQVTRSGDYTVTLSDGSQRSFTAQVPAQTQLTGWTVDITRWQPGDTLETRTESLFGKTVTETAPTTEKTLLQLQVERLAGWKDLPGVGADAIGTAVYTTAFTWDGAADGAYLDFGRYTDAYPVVQALAVYLNGQHTADVSMTRPVVDLTPWLTVGENTLELRYASNVSNLLGDVVPTGWWQYHTEKHNYGPKEATLIPYVNISMD